MVGPAASGTLPTPTMLVSAALIALGMTWYGADAAAQQTKLNQAVAQLEADVQELSAEPLRPKNLRSDTFIEERLTDGELFYRLKDYLRASIIFTDIVENYPTHRAFPDALFMLGESLFAAGDYLGARTRYVQVIDRAAETLFRPFVQKSLGRLIQIAIKTRDFDGVEGYFQRLSQVPSSELEATTAYFRAKYLYNRAVDDGNVGDNGAVPERVDTPALEQARQGFSQIALDSPFGMRARYFVGVIHTLNKNYPQAIQAFTEARSVAAPQPDEIEILPLVHLALGRVYYETDKLEDAIAAYRAVSRTSEHFPEALYEIAWVYIRRGDSVQAQRALEVLSVAAPNHPLIPDAQILRGNLLLRNGRLDEANEVFRQVRNEFGPVKRELDDVVASHNDLHAHFRGLVSQNMDDFDVNDFLPESARRWVELEGDYDRALTVLGDFSTAKRLIGETDELIARLKAALNTPNRVGVFTDLRHLQERAIALRNRATKTRAEIVTQQTRDATVTPELQAVRERKRALAATIEALPVEDEDFAERDGTELDKYRALERDIRAMRVEIQGLRARKVAAQTVLDRTGATTETANNVRTELAEHTTAIAAYEERIKVLERAVQVRKLHVGVGDERYAADQRARDEFNALLRSEQQLAGFPSEMSSALGRLEAADQRVSQKQNAIDAVVQERVASMMRVIDEESDNLVRYRQTLASLRGETEDVVGAVTYLNFNRVRTRFANLVLRADLGRVDTAWAKREEHRKRIDVLSRERARELQALDDEFRDVMDEGIEQEDDAP